MWQSVFMISGYIVGILGLIMLIPAGFDAANEIDALGSPFVVSSLITMFCGFSLFLSNYAKIDRITLKQGYLITVFSWLLVSGFSALPFVLHHSVNSVTDAVFEATSGITGTGATIMTDIEVLPASILLWRSLLNYIGGLGIVIFAVALLPFLGIGGMQIFQRENSDSNEKFMPRFSYIAKRIVFMYIILTIFAGIVLWVLGMNWFDAVNHAMSAISTGGFSTKNASIGAFSSLPIEISMMFFMFMGAVPMTFYILLFRHQEADKNKQVRTLIHTIFFMGCIFCLYMYSVTDYSLLEALHYGLFTVVSIITTTGFFANNYIEWGVWVTAVILFLSLIGGCTGSTCGSIKILRWQVLGAFFKKYFIAAVNPHRVVPLKIGSINMSEKVGVSVFIYVLAFIVCLMVLTLVVSMTGLDLNTSLAAVTACITNVGAGSVASIGPVGNYFFFSETAKYILCFAMLLGRLEIITILVVISRSFWWV